MTYQWPTPEDVAAPQEEDRGLWADAAILVGEGALAESLLSTADRARWPLLLVRALMAQGRVTEAEAVLLEQGAAPVGVGDAATLTSVTLAGARAGQGDTGALNWLRGLLPHLDRGHWLLVMHLIATAADLRGDRRDGDDAWTALLGAGRNGHGEREVIRCMVAVIATRAAGQTPEALRRQLLRAVGMATDEGVRMPGRSLTAQAVRELVDRGDVSGARLLIRAARRAAPSDPALDGPERELARTGGTRTSWSRRSAWAMVAAVSAALVVAASSAWPLLLLGPACLVVWWWLGAPQGGLTRAERRVWRSLGRDEWHPVRGLLRHPTSLDVVLILVPAVLAVVAVGSLDSSRYDQADRVVRDYSAGVFWAVFLGTWVGSTIVLWLFTRLRRGPARRFEATRLADRQRAEDRICRCADHVAFAGPLAGRIAAVHLVGAVADGPPGVSGASVARCPVTGRRWLIGPIGLGGRRLALGGGAGISLPTGERAVAEPEGGVGFYL